MNQSGYGFFIKICLCMSLTGMGTYAGASDPREVGENAIRSFTKDAERVADYELLHFLSAALIDVEPYGKALNEAKVSVLEWNDTLDRIRSDLVAKEDTEIKDYSESSAEVIQRELDKLTKAINGSLSEATQAKYQITNHAATAYDALAVVNKLSESIDEFCTKGLATTPNITNPSKLPDRYRSQWDFRLGANSDSFLKYPRLFGGAADRLTDDQDWKVALDAGITASLFFGSYFAVGGTWAGIKSAWPAILQFILEGKISVPLGAGASSGVAGSMPSWVAAGYAIIIVVATYVITAISLEFQVRDEVRRSHNAVQDMFFHRPTAETVSDFIRIKCGSLKEKIRNVPILAKRLLAAGPTSNGAIEFMAKSEEAKTRLHSLLEKAARDPEQLALVMQKLELEQIFDLVATSLVSTSLAAQGNLEAIDNFRTQKLAGINGIINTTETHLRFLIDRKLRLEALVRDLNLNYSQKVQQFLERQRNRDSLAVKLFNQVEKAFVDLAKAYIGGVPNQLRLDEVNEIRTTLEEVKRTSGRRGPLFNKVIYRAERFLQFIDEQKQLALL